MSRIEKTTTQNVSQLNFSSVTGYMVAEYDEHWWEPKTTTGQSYFIISKDSVVFILHSVLYCHVVKTAKISPEWSLELWEQPEVTRC